MKQKDFLKKEYRNQRCDQQYQSHHWLATLLPIGVILQKALEDAQRTDIPSARLLLLGISNYSNIHKLPKCPELISVF